MARCQVFLCGAGRSNPEDPRPSPTQPSAPSTVRLTLVWPSPPIPSPTDLSDFRPPIQSPFSWLGLRLRAHITLHTVTLDRETAPVLAASCASQVLAMPCQAAGSISTSVQDADRSRDVLVWWSCASKFHITEPSSPRDSATVDLSLLVLRMHAIRKIEAENGRQTRGRPDWVVPAP